VAERGYCFGLGYTSWEWNERMSGWAVRDKKKWKERERKKKKKIRVFIPTWLYMWFTSWARLTEFQKSQPTTRVMISNF